MELIEDIYANEHHESEELNTKLKTSKNNH